MPELALLLLAIRECSRLSRIISWNVTWSFQLPRTKQPSQRNWLQKLELQQSLRIHYCRASGMPIMRLARGLRWTVRLRCGSSLP